MFVYRAPLSFLLVSLAFVDATPKFSRRTGMSTLSFTKRINKLSNGQNIAELDRAHVQAMRTASHLSKRQNTSFGITNQFVDYIATVGIGSPPTDYDLIIDTGCSNTWIGAGQEYVPTSSSIDTGDPVSITCGSGQLTGTEWLDLVTLSPDLVISKQSIAVVTNAGALSGFDGVLGVGPIDLTLGTVDGVSTVPTVTDNLYSQGTIPEELLGIYFVPYCMGNNVTGELTFGRTDSNVIQSPVLYAPLAETAPASYYWSINETIVYGSETLLPTAAGILDAGTTLILIATDAFQNYQSLTGGVFDENTGLLEITQEQYDQLLPLSFTIGNLTYPLSPNAQIWPRALNTEIGGSSDGIYLIVADSGVSSGSGLDFIFGYAFLERFYTVYDSSNGQVGFALTNYTSASCN